MNPYEEILKGGDLRSIGQSDKVIPLIRNSKDFDKLFELLFHVDRLIIMRAADAVEKITQEYPYYLNFHKKAILKLLETAHNKELKWHLAQIISRLKLNQNQIGKAWQILTFWALDPKESRIVRTNAIHGLFNLLDQYPQLEADYQLTIAQIEKENIPSINARLKHLKKLRP